jgi:hypothetical protein
MLRIVSYVLVCGQLIGCASSDDDQSSRCRRLRDHFVELRLAKAPKGTELKAHRRAMVQALGDGFLAKCEASQVAEIDCALKANTLQAATKCGQKGAQ